MSQVSYGTITINDLTDITDVFLQYGLAISSATVTNNYAFNGLGERGWFIAATGAVDTNTIYFEYDNVNQVYKIVTNPSSTSGLYISAPYPTWSSGYQIWIRRVTIKEGINIPEYGTPYLDKAVNQIQNNYIGLDNRLKAFFWPGDSDYPGAYSVAKTTDTGLVMTDISTYGFNTRVATAAISMGYNEIPLLEMGLLGNNFNGIKLYSPILTNNVITGNRLDATLTSEGLKLLKGGIEAGQPNQSGFIYLSTEPYGNYSIGGSTNITDWKEIIGTKFGVRADGTLYANNAIISGQIIVGSDSDSNVYTKNQVDAGFDVKGSASEVKVSADSALEQLDVVEDVVGSNSWLFKYGHFKITEDTTVNLNKQYYLAAYDYVLTSDTNIDTDKTYYIRSGSGTEEDPYIYVAVDSPDSAHLSEYYEYVILNYERTKVDNINPHEANLYELVSIDEIVADYVSSRLVSTEQGLWITTKIYNYVLTSDINIDTDKTYYIRSGSGTEEDPYEYTIVDSPDSTHLSEYYERIANDNNYRLLLSSDGIYLYGPNGIISKFGENIDFSSEHSQHIGGENSYIEFDSVTQKINIVTDQLTIGNVNPVQKIEDIEQNIIPNLQGTLDEHNTHISTQQDTLNTLTGYVDINSNQSYIRVGKKGADSYVQIDGADTKVAINIKGQDVAYMSGDRFYAPSAVVTTLYMKTELNTDNAIGTIGWIMRSNGHLSLKRVK